MAKKKPEEAPEKPKVEISVAATLHGDKFLALRSVTSEGTIGDDDTPFECGVTLPGGVWIFRIGDDWLTLSATDVVQALYGARLAGKFKTEPAESS